MVIYTDIEEPEDQLLTGAGTMTLAQAVHTHTLGLSWTMPSRSTDDVKTL